MKPTSSARVESIGRPLTAVLVVWIIVMLTAVGITATWQ